MKRLYILTNQNKTKSEIDESDFTANIMTITYVSFSIIIIELSIISYLIGLFSFILALLSTFGYYVYSERLLICKFEKIILIDRN